jgi:hypothetical protein
MKELDLSIPKKLLESYVQEQLEDAFIIHTSSVCPPLAIMLVGKKIYRYIQYIEALRKKLEKILD